MSHAWGSVFSVPDIEIIGWYEYNGTSDIACTAIFGAYDDLDAAWRSEHIHRDCREDVAQHVEVPVILWSDYGWGFGWPSRACVTCGVILGHRSEESAEDAGESAPPELLRACAGRLWLFWAMRMWESLGRVRQLSAGTDSCRALLAPD